MKKKLFIILSLLIITLIPNNVVSAKTSNELYVKTEYSKEATDYAKNNLYDYLNLEGLSYADIENTKLGQGISVKSDVNTEDLLTYHFPVIVNDEFKYIFRVCDDGTHHYTGILGEVLVEEYKSLIGKATESNPAEINISNYNLVAKINDDLISMDTDRYGNKINKNFIENENKFKKSSYSVNVLEPQNIILKDPKPEARIYKYLPIDYLEKQTSLPWCKGYVVASALRTMKKDSAIRVRNVAGNTSTSSAISDSRVISYCKSHGVTLEFFNEIATPVLVQNYISSRKLIYAGVDVQGVSANHALLIHGYDGHLYKIWNPWYSYSETYNYNINRYTSANGSVMSMYRHGRFN